MRWICVFLLMPSLASAECLGKVHFDDLAFEVEIMADLASRAQGLMFRETLDKEKGMLFVYEEDGDRAFWMKNTPLPLDILYYTSDGALNRAQENAEPFNLTPLPGHGTVVLEVNAGVFAANSDAMGVMRGFTLDPLSREDCPEWLESHPLQTEEVAIPLEKTTVSAAMNKVLSRVKGFFSPVYIWLSNTN